MIRHIRVITLGILFLLVIPVLQAEVSKTNNNDTTKVVGLSEYLLHNPSVWIQTNINKLRESSTKNRQELKIEDFNTKLDEIKFSNDMIRKNLILDKSTFRIRQFNDVRNEIESDIEDLQNLQEEVIRNSNIYIAETTSALAVEKEITFFLSKADSTIISIYNPEIIMLDSTLKENISVASSKLSKIVALEDRINNISLDLEETDRLITKYKIELINKQGQINLPPIWAASYSDYPLSFIKTIEISYIKASESIKFFFRHGMTVLHIWQLLLIVLLLIPTLLFMKNKMVKRGEFQSNKFMQNYPILASFVIGLSLIPAIFTHAPYAFLDISFILLIILVSYIFIQENRFISNRNFIIILTIFIIMKLVNFLVTPTFEGRLFFAFSLIILYPMYRIFKQLITLQNVNKLRSTIIFIILVSQMIIGWVMIIWGYYLQGRHLFLSSIDAFILAIVLYVMVNSMIDYLRVLAQLFNLYNKALHIDENIVVKTIKTILYSLAFIFFVAAYLKNINLFDDMMFYFNEWGNKPRTIGDSSFTLMNVFLFFIYSFGAIYIANFVNRAISSENVKFSVHKRSVIGSSKLLFRFFIISAGFLVGIIASGFPMSQFTILIGAFGVGIGFGLQTIFSNLVSGLIIAIEKPLAVGDIIEVDGQRGRINEMGIRSSNIRTSEGAEVVIPNALLIANKVVNWTLSDKHRRIEINLGVAYSSNPQQVIELIETVLKQSEDVLQDPSPYVFFVGLGESSLDFTVLFWVEDIRDSRKTRSEILVAIFNILKENNIEIPFPQRDLHVKTIDGLPSITSTKQ